MAYLDHIKVGSTTYDIHDARITGGVLNFRGVTDTAGWPVDGATVTETVTPPYVEGDVIINTTSGKEFVVVNTGTTQTPALK